MNVSYRLRKTAEFTVHLFWTECYFFVWLSIRTSNNFPPKNEIVPSKHAWETLVIISNPRGREYTKIVDDGGSSARDTYKKLSSKSRTTTIEPDKTFVYRQQTTKTNRLDDFKIRILVVGLADVVHFRLKNIIRDGLAGERSTVTATGGVCDSDPPRRPNGKNAVKITPADIIVRAWRERPYGLREPNVRV